MLPVSCRSMAVVWNKSSHPPFFRGGRRKRSEIGMTSRPDDASAAEDRLRHDIDSGKTGDKVDFPDPSAAPLGTDAEAGGQRTPAAAAEQDRIRERAAPTSRRDG